MPGASKLLAITTGIMPGASRLLAITTGIMPGASRLLTITIDYNQMQLTILSLGVI